MPGSPWCALRYRVWHAERRGAYAEAPPVA